MKTFIYLLAFLFINFMYSQQIKVSGKWSKTLDARQIKSAGYDYDSYYESKNNQTKISISPIPNSWYNRKYMPLKVFVQKEDQNWHSSLNLELKVSSTSHGNSTGTQYQAVTNYSSIFFETIGSKKNIPIKYRISGLSVTLPADNYSVEIIYTVLNL